MMNTNTTLTSTRVLRLKAVMERVQLARDSVYRLVRSGEFPRPLKLSPGGHASGWLESEVEAYLAKRAAARGEPTPAERAA